MTALARGGLGCGRPARDACNAAVRDSNTAIATFPAALMAGPMGFTSRQFFEAEAEARATPSVQLG